MTQLSVNDLVTLSQRKAGGYANAVDNDTLLSFINEAKDRIWAILKDDEFDYFLTSSQSTDSTKDSFFTVLSTNTRQYALPIDFHEIRFIEVLGPSGFESTIFSYLPIHHPKFHDARRSANVEPSLAPFSEYYYTIVGTNQILIAQFPEVAFNLTLWYIRMLPDFVSDADNSDALDILLPYARLMSDYAAKKIMLINQDQAQFEEWSKEWDSDVKHIAQSSGPRNLADPEFVIDFNG